jgi:CubicO group peptidase (beta-lactamase class C family)
MASSMIQRQSLHSDEAPDAAGAMTQAIAAAVAGTWSGLLERGSQCHRLQMDIVQDGRVRLLNPERDKQPLSGSFIAVGHHVEVHFPTLPAEFTGTLPNPDRIDGIWRQGGFNFPMVFSRGTVALSSPITINPLTQQRLAESRVQAGLPALATASARRGGPTRVWVDGERAMGSGIAAQSNDRWHLGSISKSMTALLVARLVDLGAMAWDDTVGDALQATVPNLHEVYRPATLRHLLSHRAGLRTNIGAEHLSLFSQDVDHACAERKIYAREALSMAPHGQLGATFKYSNCGYILAAAILEAKLGQSWESLMRMHVFEPLKLATAGFGPPGHEDAVDQPIGHTHEDNATKQNAHPVAVGLVDIPAVFGPAGRIHMSLPDLMRYLIAHRDRSDFLSKSAWATLHTPPFGGDYALGWFVRSNGAFWHSGSNDLWYVEALFDPAAGIASAAVTNAGSMSPAVGRTLLEAAAAA